MATWTTDGKMKYKVGEIYYWVSERSGERHYTTPIVFVGSGEDSAVLYPQFSGFRKQCPLVMVWEDSKNGKITPCWADLSDEDYYELTPLEKALR